jgi:FixJ family two-component response regulator
MPSILVVDDEVKLAEKLASLFALSEWEAKCVFSGEAACSLVRESEFDVILLDVRMPEMDGFETLKLILEIRPTQCVVFFTGYGDVPSAVSALRLGAWTMVEKGPPFEQIFEMVKCAFEQSREMKELRRERDSLHERQVRLDVGRTLAQATTHKLKNRLVACGITLLQIEDACIGSPALSWVHSLREDLELAEASLKNLFELVCLDSDSWQEAVPIVSENVQTACREGFRISRRLAGRKTQQCIFTEHIPENMRVLCRKGRLTDIFEECFVNSLQAAFDRDLAITVSARGIDDFVQIEVVDNGPGFDSDVMEKADLPFVTTRRGRDSRSPASNFGLGLYLVRTMVEQSGGKFQYRNVPDGGACIEIKLPRA